MSDISGGAIVDGIEIVCPFCGLKCSLGFDIHGEPLGFHEVPACSAYIEMELDDYTAEARKKIEIVSKQGLN